jgi:hypothetical protein
MDARQQAGSDSEKGDVMAKPLLRSGPRFTAWFDFNLQWLNPKFKLQHGLGYLHLGWLSIGFGWGIARDTMWDAFDRGVFRSEIQ